MWGGRWRPAAGPFAIVLCFALLAACTQLDQEEARSCRLAAVALADGPDVTIRRQGAVSGAEGSRDIRVEFSTGTGSHPGFVQCSFAAHASGRERPDLVSVRTAAGPLSDPRLFMLKRFWIDAPEADRADPLPVEGAARVPVLPAGFAYLLQTLLNALPSVASYGLLAAAYSLVYGLIGRLNLAFGEMAAVGGAGALAGAALADGRAPGLLIGVTALAAIWAASLHGFGIARLVFLPLRRATGQQGLVATIGLALALNEYLRLAQGSAPAWIPPLNTAPIAVVRSESFVVTVTPIGLTLAAAFLAAAAAVLALLGRTQFGRNWRAMADDPVAAALTGVDPVRVFTQTFLLASALAGVSGATVVLIYGNFGTALGATLGLKALLAAVLGGVGSVPGAFLGGLALGVFEAGWSAFYSIDNRDLATFVVLAAMLVARPGGIFGYADLAPRRV